MYIIDVSHRPVADGAEHAPHASPQTSVAFAPDGARYASGGYDGRVVVFDRDGAEPRWTGRHHRLVNGVRFSPSGRLLASVSADKTCRVWDAADGTLVQVLSRQPDDLNSLAWIDEERLVTVSQDGTGRIWNIAAGTLDDRALFHSDHCMSVDANRDGVLATCGEDAAIRLWEPDGLLRRTLPQDGHAEMCRWAPDGSRLAVSCDDGYVHVLGPDGELHTKLGPYTAAVKSVAWSPDGRRLAIGAYDSTVSLWDAEHGRRLIRWYGSQLWPRSLDFSADGRTLIAGTIATRPALLDVDGPGGADRTVPARTGTYGVNHLAAHGPVLAAACDDGTVRVWRDDRTTADEFTVGNGSLVNTVAVAGDILAYGTFSGEIGLVSLADGSRSSAVQREHPVNRVSFSPSGRQLAVADYEGALDLYGATGGTLVEVSAFRGHHGAVKDVAWVDDDHLVTVSTDRTACLVSRDGGVLRTFTGHGELINAGSVTTVDGRRLLATVSRDRTVRVHDLDSGTLLTVLGGHDESVKAVAWKPSGEPVLLTGSYDFTGRVWTLDPATWEVSSVERLEGHGNAVSSVAWLGAVPVTGAWDARVHLWPEETDGARAPRPLPTAWAGAGATR